MSWQMCQNDRCEHFRVQTKLKGGCECGEPLVAYLPADRPTLREIAEFCSRVATSDPEKPNVSVEDAEDGLRRRPDLQENFIRRLGQLEASIADHRATA